MICWRLATSRRPEIALAGEGARRYGGRWNPVGTPVVYAATTLALAALEVLGHVDPVEARPYWYYRLELPDALVERLAREDAPRGWDASPPRPASARVGGAWAAAHRSLALLVPSVHVPTWEELNVLIDPRHPEIGKLGVGPATPYAFDPRLVKARPS